MQIPDMYKPILAKLASEQERFHALEEEMNSPTIASRPARLVELAKEHGKLGRHLEKYRTFMAAQKTLEETQILAGDPDMKALADAELPALLRDRDAALEEIVSTFLSAEELAVDSMIMEIRA